MSLRQLALRLLAAVVAVVQATASGAASIIDARPAALAMSERETIHYEEPGSPHAIAHQDQCALCGLAMHQQGEPEAPVELPDGRAATWPAHATWLVRHTAGGIDNSRSRAPPA